MCERQPRVLVGELCKAPLLAARRGPHVDGRSAQLGEELGEGLRVSDVRRDDHLGRHARGGRVVLEAERLEDRRPVLSLDVLEMEGVAVDQPSVSEREQLHGGPIAVRREADHVDRAHGPSVGPLSLREALDREQAVAIPCSLLVALGSGGFAHLPLELTNDRARLAGEKGDDAVDLGPVLLRRDRPDTRRRAPLDVEIETRDPRVPPRLRPFARPELKHPVEHVERFTHLLRIGVRPEVHRAAAVPLTGEHDAGILVGDGDRDVRKRLVVAQPHVERRPVPLDEVLLEVQRFRFALRDDHLDPAHALHHAVDTESLVAAVEVAAHAGAQGLGLADVEDIVRLAAEEIDAGASRQPPQLFPDVVGHDG